MSSPDHAALAPGEVALDPFSYQPGMASAIAGLGGAVRHQDPGYAFHTEYVPVAEGPGQFTLRFQGLRAKTGTLLLRVHMMIEDDPSRLMLGNTWRGQFNRIAQLGGEVTIRFDGFRRVRYALYGAILGETDACADALTIMLDRPADAGGAGDADGAFAELRNSDFGGGTTRPVPLLIATDAPTLARPVSQAATEPQTREPAFAEWAGKLGAGAPAREAWAAAYVLQCLRVYGVLHPAARGVGFGEMAEATAAALAAAGVAATPAAPPTRTDDLPGALVNFDFLWSIDAVGGGGDGECFDQILAMLRCVRPGGLAVHVLPYRPGADQRARDLAAAAFRRGDVERLALLLIARKVEVAQVRIDDDLPLLNAAGVGAFGLVMRRPTIQG